MPVLAADPAARLPAARHVEGLDGLRAVAAVGVLAYHVHFLVGPSTGPVAALAGVGWIGVDLFFAISGFILFLPFARAHRDGRPVPLRRFFVRRARRILPAYWFNLFVLVTLTVPGILATPSGWATVLADATFTADYLGRPSINSVYWSLYCEVAFYVALPLVARAFVGRRWLVGLPAAIVLAAGYRTAVVLAAPDAESHASAIMQFPGVLDQFAYGMAVGAVWAWAEVRRDRIPRWAGPAVAAVGVALVASVVLVVHRLVGMVAFWSADHAWGVPALAVVRPGLSAGFALLILGLCFARNPLRRVLELRPLRYLGTVSYGLYLWHLPVVRALADGLGDVDGSGLAYLGAVLAVLALTLPWAAFSYHVVEQRYLERPATAPTAGPAG
ncbi:acyltransferase family protein [Actinotalea subterranea]|uniref:acyltransferase family protein n=1 Tax=Actinotalea subterranea TaxID=2607497 RepID=UPI00165E17AD|nr:acyltransferase [Actinotalea subterranea]